MKCIYCNSEFSTNHNLRIHQKRSKYCLNIQIKLNPDIDIKTDFKDCKDCQKSFATNIFNRHVSTCKIRIKKTKEIEKNNIDKIKILEQTIKEKESNVK